MALAVEELAAHATQERFVYYHQWRVGDLLMAGAGHIDFLARKARLIDHDDARIGPLNGFNHERFRS